MCGYLKVRPFGCTICDENKHGRRGRAARGRLIYLASTIPLIMPKDTKPPAGNTPFHKMVGTVTPMPKNNTVAGTTRPKPVLRSTRAETRQALVQADEAGGHVLNMGDELRYIKPGVTRKTLRQLRRGQYSIKEKIDLHGMTVDEARKQVSACIGQGQREPRRAIKIIHGKGLRAVNHEPVLKNKINLWLRQYNNVLAFCSAPPNDGGAGAAYVLIGKD